MPVAVSKLVDMRAVCSLTGLSRGTIYILVKDGHFPPPVRIGKRRIAWRETDISCWLDQRATPEWAAA